jgi:hypothetical protein
MTKLCDQLEVIADNAREHLRNPYKYLSRLQIVLLRSTPQDSLMTNVSLRLSVHIDF